MANRKSPRRGLLASIHIAKKEIGLDEEAYRAALHAVTGKRSCGKMTIQELRRVAAHFGATRSNPNKGKPPATKIAGKDPKMSKVGALLADMKLPWSYADGIARNMFKVDSVRWCSPEQLTKIIVALVHHQKRQGKSTK